MPGIDRFLSEFYKVFAQKFLKLMKTLFTHIQETSNIPVMEGSGDSTHK